MLIIVHARDIGVPQISGTNAETTELAPSEMKPWHEEARPR